MPILRIENFRNGAWEVRGEGPVPADTAAEAIRAQAERTAINGPARAFLDGALVFETAKLTRKRAKALFGL